MKIDKSKYYLRITEPLRAAALSKNVKFGEEGFSYTSYGLAFVLVRQSKNNYRIDAINPPHMEKYEFESCGKAVEFAIRLVELDIKTQHAQKKDSHKQK